MKNGILIFISVFICFSAWAFDYDRYITVDKYLSLNPEQAELMKNFSAVVSAESSEYTDIPDKKIKIVVVYPANQKSRYWLDSVKTMEARLNELGIKYELLKYYSDLSAGKRMQIEQLAEAVRQNPDYMAVSVDNDNIKRYVSDILLSGKTKVIIQNLTTPLSDWAATPPLMYVGFDHITGAVNLAEHYSSLLPRGGKYIMLYGSKGIVSDLRGKGFETAGFTKGFIPAAKYYTDFKPEKAYEAVMQELGKDRNTAFIYPCSTDIAIGAARALKELGLSGKVLINGWGGTLQELEMVKEGSLDFTVMRMNDDNGVAIAEAVRMDITGRTDKIPQIFSGEFVMVTKDMPDTEIDTLIKKAMRYSLHE